MAAPVAKKSGKINLKDYQVRSVGMIPGSIVTAEGRDVLKRRTGLAPVWY
jgi:hypothetical protein